MNYLLNIDWLQVHCYCTLQGDSEEVINHSPLFTLKLQPDSGRVYAEKYRVYDDNGQWLYDFYRKPKTPVINPLSAQVRLSNQECYTRDFCKRLNYFLQCFSCEFRNISRIDICSDFMYFAGRLNPFNVIKDFMSSKLLLRRNAKFSVYGFHRFDLDFECLKIGSASSAVSVKLYNKTAEMLAVKMKPYIVEEWSNANICHSLTPMAPVWRLEFSLTADAQELIELQTGELIRTSIEWADLHANLLRLFLSLQLQYFDIVKNDGKKNKSRMQSITLFTDNCEIQIKPIRVNSIKCSNRMDKYIIKRLITECSAMRIDKKIYTADDITHLTAFLYRFALAHKVYKVAEYIEKGEEVEEILKLLNNY